MRARFGQQATVIDRIGTDDNRQRRECFRGICMDRYSAPAPPSPPHKGHVLPDDGSQRQERHASGPDHPTDAAHAKHERHRRSVGPAAVAAETGLHCGCDSHRDCRGALDEVTSRHGRVSMIRSQCLQLQFSSLHNISPFFDRYRDGIAASQSMRHLHPTTERARSLVEAQLFRTIIEAASRSFDLHHRGRFEKF